jgi:hypothetical protein
MPPRVEHSEITTTTTTTPTARLAAIDTMPSFPLLRLYNRRATPQQHPHQHQHTPQKASTANGTKHSSTITDGTTSTSSPIVTVVEDQENSPSTVSTMTTFSFLELEQHVDYESSSSSTKDLPRAPLHSHSSTNSNNAITCTSPLTVQSKLNTESKLTSAMSKSISKPSFPIVSKKSISKSNLKSSTKQQKKQRKNVKFDSLHIRTFQSVLGDHPCCSTGLPITLAWKHIEEKTVHIDDYESLRLSPKRDRQNLRLSDVARRDILSRPIHEEDDCRGNGNTNSNGNTVSNPSTFSSQHGECLSAIDLKRAERRAFRNRERQRKRAAGMP